MKVHKPVKDATNREIAKVLKLPLAPSNLLLIRDIVGDADYIDPTLAARLAKAFSQTDAGFWLRLNLIEPTWHDGH